VSGLTQEEARELAHALRTPIAVILGFSDLLMRPGELSEEDRLMYASRIRSGAEELRTILDDRVRRG
jgi:signal transduction histidine kinase